VNKPDTMWGGGVCHGRFLTEGVGCWVGRGPPKTSFCVWGGGSGTPPRVFSKPSLPPCGWGGSTANFVFGFYFLFVVWGFCSRKTKHILLWVMLGGCGGGGVGEKGRARGGCKPRTTRAVSNFRDEASQFVGICVFVCGGVLVFDFFGPAAS